MPVRFTRVEVRALLARTFAQLPNPFMRDSPARHGSHAMEACRRMRWLRRRRYKWRPNWTLPVLISFPVLVSLSIQRKARLLRLVAWHRERDDSYRTFDSFEVARSLKKATIIRWGKLDIDLLAVHQ